jgi:hypothetical protein
VKSAWQKGHDDFYKSYVLFVGLVQRKIMVVRGFPQSSPPDA